MPTATIDLSKVKPGTIITGKKPQAMWTVLEDDLANDRVRVVRANKLGEIHGLVKKKDGEWWPANRLNTLQIFGEVGNITPTTKASTKGKVHKATKRAQKAVLTPKNMSTSTSDGTLPKQLYTAMADVHDSLAKQFRTLSRSIHAPGKRMGRKANTAIGSS